MANTITEFQVERALERGGRFFKTVARNPVVRGALFARGLSDEELQSGWGMYAALHGFTTGSEARPATSQTAAAEAINRIDGWDAPTFTATRAVLTARFPPVLAFLFENLEASEGVQAVVGAARFLDRIAALREGKAPGIAPELGQQAVALLEARKLTDATREAELRGWIATAQLGARPEEVVPAPEMDPRRRDVAASFIAWLHEWREIARVAVTRRDYRIALGISQRRRSDNEEPPATDTPEEPAS